MGALERRGLRESRRDIDSKRSPCSACGVGAISGSATQVRTLAATTFKDQPLGRFGEVQMFDFKKKVLGPLVDNTTGQLDEALGIKNLADRIENLLSVKE